MSNEWKAVNYFTAPMIIVMFLEAVFSGYFDGEALVVIFLAYFMFAGIFYSLVRGVEHTVKFIKEDKE